MTRDRESDESRNPRKREKKRARASAPSPTVAKTDGKACGLSVGSLGFGTVLKLAQPSSSTIDYSIPDCILITTTSADS